MAGSDVPDEVKVKVAQEVLNTLPPAALCGAATHTRAWLQDAIQAQIDDLKATHDRPEPETPQAPPKQAETVPERKARQKSVGK